MSKKEIATYCPKSRTDWRKWLGKSHQSNQSVWLVYFKSSTKVAKLIQNNLMTKADFDSIETAKHNGTWLLMDDVEKLIIPEDLRIALNKNESSMEFFQSQSKSIKKAMLHWVVIAKRVETRKKRIAEIARLAAKEIIPNQFR